MAEKDIGDPGVLLFGDVGQLFRVIAEHERVLVLRAEIAERVLVIDREAVTEVVVAIDSDAALSEPSCHAVIAVDVLRHAVDQLQDRLDGSFGLPGNCVDVGISDDGRECEFFFQNWHINNLL